MILIHNLDGCAPAPLAHYLKALGILRIVGEQADEQARGWWEGPRFRLATVLSRSALEHFFLCQYRPTPLVSPWNGGSGFYPGDKKARKVHDSIVGSDSPRLQGLKRAIESGRALVAGLKKAPDGEAKDRFISACSQRWRDQERRWLQAALVISGDGKAKFPALLGTGGNDGRFDFASNFLIRFSALVDASGKPTRTAESLLNAALWNEAAADLLTGAAGKVGQFLPSGAGGANSVNGPGSQDSTLLNPWDFVLMLEGAILFAAHAVKRLAQGASPGAAAPFVVSAHAAGYASASVSDEAARGEQWMPLWRQPMTLVEGQHLIAEGRAQLGASQAGEPLDLARAAARLGIARGITAFQRFGYIERNGQSNLAVPLGRFDVRDRPAPAVNCLDDLAPWMQRLRRQARDKGASAQLVRVEKNLADAAFEAIQSPALPTRWQSVLLALAGVESVMRRGSGFKAQPVPPLRPEWVSAADDGSAEFRLALAFALQATSFRRSSGRPIGAVRSNWLPLDDRLINRFATTGDAQHLRLQVQAQVVMHGRDGIADALALLERRLVDASSAGMRRFPLQPAARAAAHAADLSAWLAGAVDADRTVALARALMALDRGLWAEQIVSISRPAPAESWPDDAWLALRLAHLHGPLPDGRVVPCDPAILRRLASGDAASAVTQALRRLRAAGLRSSVRAAAVPPDTARRWAAALAFPVHAVSALRFARRLDPTFAEEQLA